MYDTEQRGQQVFSKGQTVSVSGLAGYLVCVTTTQFCHWIEKAAVDNVSMNGMAVF